MVLIPNLTLNCRSAELEALNSDLTFVVILEHFEASLSLLSEELCWPMYNFAAVKQKARPDNFRVNLKQKKRMTYLSFIFMETSMLEKEFLWTVHWEWRTLILKKIALNY